MYCVNCGKQLSDLPNLCPECGHPRLDGNAFGLADTSPKSKVAAMLLCWFFGVLGLHRFYVGKIGTGLLMLCTFGGFGIWILIDLVYLICDKFTDKKGKFIRS
ncbi:MAG: TM2 domain-containing protein [Planctomycetota bacterium]|jgi:hypothetical protein|nr:TM2 domain-containing protein [Planctomycetota bacterium]